MKPRNRPARSTKIPDTSGYLLPLSTALARLPTRLSVLSSEESRMTGPRLIREMNMSPACTYRRRPKRGERTPSDAIGRLAVQPFLPALAQLIIIIIGTRQEQGACIASLISLLPLANRRSTMTPARSSTTGIDNISVSEIMARRPAY
ncbi:hypothetical protein BO70DRAFT_90535 [Aspergillus heteromorphus CBS 117.55]|uniref:Uncharacterized protein n=1 Tax=Aspergillus heteromorphus CBS 117.55 TaxID=1448321 RepID=A0A317VTB4_9EURO|nr:uncharacterized protein BO70DRAFT_90535 [Aspergillus heteromorphus CBS 117.55]PWY76182.1 hypothetical protein BO70DRAFT_90535 [Aspergillus heteromorphus CBS 117.55]